MIKNPNSYFTDIPEYSKEDVRNKGEDTVKRYIKSMMKDCSIVICLVGNNCHNSFWIDYEIEIAKSQKKPIIAVRVPDTTGANPLMIRNEPEIQMKREEILKKIRSYHGY